MARRYRVKALATVEFLSDTLEWMGERASPDIARGQFMDTVRLNNKEGESGLRVMPDFQGAVVTVVDEHGDEICPTSDKPWYACDCGEHKA